HHPHSRFKFNAVNHALRLTWKRHSLRCSCLAGAPTMKARELINSASYGPETLKIVFQSFDSAWGSIAHNFGTTLSQSKPHASSSPISFSAYRTTIKAM